MHRVLSYQTAMQINDDRDIRAFITKQTCISLIFSVSFFTLIIGKIADAINSPEIRCTRDFSHFPFCFFFGLRAGFLLGKFVSDRNLKIRQMQQPEYFADIQQLQQLRQSIEVHAFNVSQTHMQFKHLELNRRLWKTIDSTCKHSSIEPHFDVDFNAFAAKLADNEMHNHSDCMRRIIAAIKEIGFGTD